MICSFVGKYRVFSPFCSLLQDRAKRGKRTCLMWRWLQDAGPQGGMGGGCLSVALGLLCSVTVTRCEMQGCPSACLCAGDVFACSGRNISGIPTRGLDLASRLDLSYNHISSIPADWTPRPLGKLEMLVLSHNVISHVSPKALCRVPIVRYLDLSSNRVKVLSVSMFCSLTHLEVLLLYDNQISKISPQTFMGLSGLQKVYLSWNAISEFPTGILEGNFSPPYLEFLDLSNNLLREVPIQEVLSLPVRKQAGIYLHGNPLACDCTLQVLLQYWSRRKFLPVLDFWSEYKCFLPSPSMDINLWSLNCSGSAVDTPVTYTGGESVVHMGTSLVLPCGSVLPWRPSPVLWTTPDRTTLWTGDHTDALSVFPNGSLRLTAVQPEHSGTYTCVAFSPAGNLSWSVEVSVMEHDSSAETVSTALTTLGSCGVSLVLVLLYLYLTPCCSWARSHKDPHRCHGHSVLSRHARCDSNDDILRDSMSDTLSKDTGSPGKRVVFLLPEHDRDEDTRCPR